MASCCCVKSRRRSYAILSKRQRMLEIRNGPREAILESVTDSGNSCFREEHPGKCGHTSQSSYIVNEPHEQPNTTMALMIKSYKNGRHLSWMPCITQSKQDFEDTRLGNESSRIHRQSLASNISNSSLKDVDRAALEDELTSYMKELARRERKQDYTQRFLCHE